MSMDDLPDRIPEPERKGTPLDMADYAAQLLAETWQNVEATLAGRPDLIAHRVMDELGLFPVLERRILEGHLDDTEPPSV